MIARVTKRSVLTGAPNASDEGAALAGARMDRIEEIVARAIGFTDLVLSSMPEHADLAIESLQRLRETLSTNLPGHSALKQLDEYLAEVERTDPPDNPN
jgi:hypothetical protein